MEPKTRERLVKAIYEMVWSFRAFMDKETAWKTPHVSDALQFAVTEMGEVADAEIRGREYARNNDRSPTVVSELADVAFMLATAMPIGRVAMEDIVRKPLRLAVNKERTSLPYINMLVAMAWHDWSALRFQSAEVQMAQALHMAVAAIGEGADVAVAKRLLRIYDKNSDGGDVPDVVNEMRQLAGEGDGDE